MSLYEFGSDAIGSLEHRLPPWQRDEQGFIAFSSRDGAQGTRDIPRMMKQFGAKSPRLTSENRLQLVTWGMGRPEPKMPTMLLTRGARRGDSNLSLDAVEAMLAGNPSQLNNVLPPFAAIRLTETSLQVLTDYLGYRHVYHCHGEDWAAVSSSSRALSLLCGARIDREAAAVQSLLGWQIGNRTMFEDVTKVAPGVLLTLVDGRIVVEDLHPPRVAEQADAKEAVKAAADFLRNYLTSFLDENPEACLQLTGGQDSRLLLSAIPPERRRGLHVMTVQVPGSEDVQIAARLAARFGMNHQIVSFDGLTDLSPEVAYDLCISSSRRLECMADPLALAGLAFVESKMKQGPRISGLGGEVARGFYYFGPVIRLPVMRCSVGVLASWMMFANDAVKAEALEPRFVRWARDFTIDEIWKLIRATGQDWFRATDELYLRQRMHRWAGLTSSAVCFDREEVNPMLDNRFIDIVSSLSPRHKRRARFLGQLQVMLDPELADMPLDGRPSPRTLAYGGIRNSAASTARILRKIRRKAAQLRGGARRPPAGGEILARKAVEHWQCNPRILDGVRDLGIFRDQWLDEVATGVTNPDLASVAMLVNLLAAR